MVRMSIPLEANADTFAPMGGVSSGFALLAAGIGSVCFLLTVSWSSGSSPKAATYRVVGDVEYAVPSVDPSPLDDWPKLPFGALLAADGNCLSEIVETKYWNPLGRVPTVEDLDNLRSTVESGSLELRLIQQVIAQRNTEILDAEIASGRAHKRVGKLHLPCPTRSFEFIVRSTGGENYCVELNRTSFPDAMELRDYFFIRALEVHDAIREITAGRRSDSSDISQVDKG